jgi:hypothetical protein
MAKKSIKQDDYKRELWERVKCAEEYHKKYFVDSAEKSMRFLRGDTSYLPADFQYDIINPNLIFSTIRTYTPALYPAFPKIFAKPRGPEWGPKKKDNVFSAFLAQNALDYYQYELDMKKTDKMAVLGSLTHGLAYVMDAWVFEKSNLNPTITKDQPMHRFVSGIDLIPDPEGLEFEDKSFVVRTFGKRIDQMKKSGYKNLPEEEIAYSGIDNKTKQPILTKFYEIWDKNSEKVYLASELNGVEEWHDERDFDISMGFPFTPLILNPMIDNYYPMSLVDVLITMQKFITLMVSYGARHAKMSVPKFVGFSEYFDEASLRALKSGKIQDFIALKRKGVDDKTSIDQIISSLRLPGLPTDFYNMVNIVRDFMNSISGVNESTRQETATGSSIVDSYLRSRMGDYKSIVDDFIVSSRRKVLAVIKKNSTSDKYLRFNKMDLFNEYFYPNPQAGQGDVPFPKPESPQGMFMEKMQVKGNYVFVPWNNKDISGEYDLVLGVGNGLPDNEEFAYKKALQNYNIMANDPNLDRVKVRLKFLRDLGVPDAEAWITPPPPPPQPEKPKMAFNISLKGDDVPPEIEAEMFNQMGITPQPSQGVGMGNEAASGKEIRPINVGLQRELGNVVGLQNPPNMPEINGGNNG